MVTAAVPEKQINCVSLQLFSVRVALFFALGFFSFTFGFLFGLFFGILFFHFLFFLFFSHGRLLSGFTLFGNGLTGNFGSEF